MIEKINMEGIEVTLKELELFYALSEHPHISQLAEKTGMSQSAISLAIKSLEHTLGEPLFDRIGKKLVLNERGRFFKSKTHDHFLALKDGEQIFGKDKMSGLLKIASSKTIGNFVIPQIIFDFLSRHQECHIQDTIVNSADIIRMVREGSVDMGLIESACDHSDIIKEKFGSDELIVVSSDRELSTREYYIDQLFDRRWILREPGSGTREIFLKYIEAVAGDLEIFMQYRDSEEIKTLLLQNTEVITCVSRYVVERELRSGMLFEVPIKNLSFQRDFFIIYHKNKYRSRMMEALIASVRAKENP